MGRNDLDRPAVGLVKAGALEHLQVKVALQDAAVPLSVQVFRIFALRA